MLGAPSEVLLAGGVGLKREAGDSVALHLSVTHHPSLLCFSTSPWMYTPVLSFPTSSHTVDSTRMGISASSLMSHLWY